MKTMRKNRFISALLILALLLTLAPALGGTARADAPTTEWSAVEYRDTSWGSDYDSATTFTIADEKDFAQFAYLVNTSEAQNNFNGKTVKLAADLNLSAHKWTPIGNDSDHGFKGTFDGGGHTVSGMYINYSPVHTFYAGLFGFLDNGTVQNLNVSGSVSVTLAEEQNAYVGGVVGENSGSSEISSTVENCYYSGSITVEGSSNTTIYAGGIVGYNYYYGTVDNCCHSGSVKANGLSATYVGGIVGYNKSNSTVTNCCHNGSNGSIISTEGSNSNAYAGGVVACNESRTVSNCDGCGNIKAATGSGDTASAIAGGVVGTNNEYDGKSTVTNCYHYGGDVTAKTNGTSGNTAAGGVVGYNNKSEVKNCYHSGGDVKATSKGTSPNIGAGGVVGIKQWSDDTVSQCYFLSEDTVVNGIGLNGVNEAATDDGAWPLTAEQFKDQSSFTNGTDPWDFTYTWIMDANRPRLRSNIGTADDPFLASSWSQLYDALRLGGYVKLAKDVTYINNDPAPLTVPENTTAALDLGGHIVDRGLTRQPAVVNGSVLTVVGALTLMDSDPTAQHDPAITYTDPIDNTKTHTVTGGVITGGGDNNNGGGVNVDNGGTFTMNGGTVCCNTAQYYGGGVYVYNGGTFTMNGGTITGNTAVTFCGGGVYSVGIFTMSGGTICGNTALNSYGGGVNIGTNSTFNMTGGSITNNKAAKDAGGVYINNGCVFTMSGGSITGNVAVDYGGGVWLNGHATFKVSGTPRITGNKTGDQEINVYLAESNGSHTMIAVDGALTEEGDAKASIGVTMQTPGVFTSGLSGKGTAANFSSDDPAYGVVLQNGEAKLAPAYSVKITAGTGMTKTEASGAATQTGLTGAMTEVVYTADDGYYFPENYTATYSVADSGVTAARSDATKVTVSGTPTKNVTVTLPDAAAKTKESTPNAKLEATGPDCGTLSDVTTAMKYSVDGGASWAAITGTTMDITGVTAEKDVKIYKVAADTDTRLDSDVQTIDVTKAAKPTGVGKTDCTTEEDNNGKITGVTTAMEYQKSGTEGWTAITGESVTGLVPGTYSVRVRAVGTALASDTVDVTIDPAPRYTLNVESGTGGGSYVAGTQVTITADAAPSGKVFDKWTSEDGVEFDNATSAETTIQMPAKNVTVTATYKNKPSSGGYTPVPTPTEPKITIPVAGEGAIQLEVTVSGDTATVSPLTDEQISAVVTGEDPVDVVFDLSSLGAEIENVNIPTESVKKLAQALADHPGEDTVTITTANGAVTFNEASLHAILDGTTGEYMTLRFALTGKEELNDAQTHALDGKEVMGNLDLSVLVGGVPVINFGGGRVKVSFPFTPPEGREGRRYQVWYVSETGALERMVTSFLNDILSFLTPHCSNYVLTYEERPFEDVAEDDWFYEAAYYSYDMGWFKGVKDDRFDPDGDMSRAMFATVLYRIAGEPDASGLANPFDDVEAGKWYYDAVLWAANEKIIEGYGNGKFGTNDPITREQIVTIFWRYMGKPKTENDDLSGFSDADQISDWAKEAMAWAVSVGVIEGKPGGVIDPQGTATRAEVAQIVMNYDTKAG